MNVVDKILKIINNSNFWSLISIIVVAITSYTVAKYNASKPNKIKVKQLQLENVYLPLFRLFEKIPEDPSIEYATYLHDKTTLILDNYYELVFPQLHKLNRKLNYQLNHLKPYNETLFYMKHQITLDYELLKKSLGYPSESLYTIFIRMPHKRKVYLYWLFFRTILLILSLIFVIYPSINPKYHFQASIVIFLFAIFFLSMGIFDIKKAIKH